MRARRMADRVGKRKTVKKVKEKPSGGDKKVLFSKKELEIFERRLLEERAKILKQLGVFGENYTNTLKDSSGDLSSYSFHMADMGTDAMEREKAFLFASQEGRLLYHIDEALRRLYKGDNYGLCQMCGSKIEKKRLEALPHARLCIECKAKEESGS
jgi:RNA polymerase-binding protein DksA